MRRLVGMKRPRNTKPRTRHVHANPTLGMRDCMTKGKMTPPTEPPAAAIPVALPRPLRKKCPIAETAGVKMREKAMPAITPQTSMNW